MALIGHKPQFIFIHIFKCAGHSIRWALRELHTGELHGVHVEAKDVQQHFIKTGKPAFYEKAFKFTFVRNPYDWMVSTYYYIRKSKIHFMHEEAMSMTYEQWLGWYLDVFHGSERPYGSNKYLTLKEFISDSEGNVIVDYVGKTETIQGSFNDICDAIGIPKVALTKRNVGIGNNRQADYRQYYNDNSKAMIQKAFGEDLDYFEYAF